MPGPLAEDVPQGHVDAADSALPSTGPFRQYELTNDDCQMSSICSGSLPIRNGLQVLVDGRLDDAGPLRERGAAQAVQPRLAGHAP